MFNVQTLLISYPIEFNKSIQDSTKKLKYLKNPKTLRLNNTELQRSNFCFFSEFCFGIFNPIK